MVDRGRRVFMWCFWRRTTVAQPEKWEGRPQKSTKNTQQLESLCTTVSIRLLLCAASVSSVSLWFSSEQNEPQIMRLAIIFIGLKSQDFVITGKQPPRSGTKS